MVNLWLDDIRPAPAGWAWIKNVDQAKVFFILTGVDKISLDHDLGENLETGYDLLTWIEKRVAEKKWAGPMPQFSIHSANPVGRKNMLAAIESIEKLYGKTSG